MAKAGRKALIDDWITADNLLRIEGWAREGITDKQIAEAKMGISERSFSRWKVQCPAIVSALKKGRAPCEVEVENSLYKSAMGYTVTVKEPIKIREEKQAAGKGRIVTERVEMVEREVYIPPSTAAQIFFLKNRRADRWKDHPVAESKEVFEKLDEMLSTIGNIAKKDAEVNENPGEVLQERT